MPRFALIGMACVFPGAPDLAHYWENITGGVDAITDAPPERIDPQFFDADSSAVDRFYCRRGGFVDAYARFAPMQFGVMPRAAEAAEPDQLLTLRVAFDALADAGYAERDFARARTGVIIGRGNYISAGVLRLEQHVRMLPQILQTLQDLLPDLPAETLSEARQRIGEQLTYYGPDVAAGMIPNLIASRIANRLDLHGPAYTVDAACASSLIAVEQACASLAAGGTDMMLVGGAHLTHDLTFWATFCQLGALSRTSQCSPLSADADGILAGEGVGMVVIKRLADAERDGDRIYAVIEGAGSSSDGRASSLVAPSPGGQLLALQRAWAGVAFAPADVGLVEAHGTGTAAGDSAELETMRDFFGAVADDSPRAVIGSVKSMIGHCMPAAGIAGLIKAALAVYHGVLPPSLHCEHPHPQLAATRFRVLDQAQTWTTAQGERIAAVNAFGFGGINAHVVLRGAASLMPQRKLRPPEVLTLAADTPEALLARLHAGERDLRPGAGRCRLAILAPDARKIAMAHKAIAAGKPWRGRQQIYYTAEGLLPDSGKLAFVFPGVDSRFAPQAADLADFFGQPLPAYCQAADPQQALLPVVLGLLGFNRYLFARLTELGVVADAMAGHSIGEWSAMLCAGMMDQALSDRTNASLDFGSLKFPDVLFLAASCPVDTLRAGLAGLDNIAISHDNCPNQSIACGSRGAIDALAARLGEARVLYQILPIVSGFHSPLFAAQMDWYREFFGRAELVDPAVPVWSATTASLYPAGMDARRQLALDHLLQPVRFRELTEALYADGVRVFVQVGTGSLSGFINDTLGARPHLAISANSEARSGLEQLGLLCAALWAEGLDFDTRLLDAPIARPDGPDIALKLGVPLLRVKTPLSWRPRPALGAAEPAGLAALSASDPVERLLSATLADIDRNSRDLLALWREHRRTRPHPESAVSATPLLAHRETRRLDLDSTIPWVDDHALYPQRTAWPVRADRHPVVPMTMEIMMLVDAVEGALPGRRVTGVRAVEAYNWLVVSSPVDVEIVLNARDAETVQAEITGYFRAELSLADTGVAPWVPAALVRSRAPRITASQLYAERWMFHGPAYQGVRALSAIGDNGIDGVLVSPVGQGALLDNMGQLAGYWVMEQPENCLAMPIGLEGIRFFGDRPQIGEVFDAQVRVRELDALNCVTDHLLRDNSGQVRVEIRGWRTRRYQMDERFWLASRQLEHTMVSHPLADGMVLFDDQYDTAILRDYLARRYLSAPEMAVYETLSPRRRRAWLNGRVAAKDAVRHFLWQHGAGPLHPKECRIENLDSGQPVVRANITDNVPAGLHLSIAHKGNLALARVDTQPVGVDLETVQAREPGFVAMAFGESERLLLGTDPDLLTRGWVAKEVVGKTAGTGLAGALHALAIEALAAERLLLNGQWVATARFRNYILGWNASPQRDADVRQRLHALATVKLSTT
jgi:acyl transferase domain-containing protein/phosphopantetheinyl transferase